MSDADSDLIRIELRLDGRSPTGRATATSGGTRGFTGWVGLMSAVDALAADATAAEGTPPEDEPWSRASP
jgi:hypothetical protein